MGDDDANDGPDLSLFAFDDDEQPAGENKKDMTKRHNREEQQIRTEFKAKKHSIHKADRAARNAVDAELDVALEEMRVRHARELGSNGDDELEAGMAAASISGQSTNVPKGGTKKKTKKQKAEEAERAREKRIADHHAGAGPSERDVEMGKLEAQLSPLGLKIHEIPADGHCLYRSLAHQLQAQGEAVDFLQCRKEIAAHIRANAADFAPYIDAAEGGSADIASYCAVVADSSEWGGQLEITALAHARKRKVTVFSADAPPLHTGDEYTDQGPPIELAYHRHYYGLGEHYNAVAPS